MTKSISRLAEKLDVLYASNPVVRIDSASGIQFISDDSIEEELRHLIIGPGTYTAMARNELYEAGYNCWPEEKTVDGWILGYIRPVNGGPVIRFGY